MIHKVMEARMVEHKLRRPVRNQTELNISCLDDLIPDDHRARQVWRYVDRLDLSPLLEGARSFIGGMGAPTTDPKIMLSLWLFAVLDGVGSARELERLTNRDSAYRWICGGVSVNYHSLSSFRTMAGPFLDGLLTKSVAALVSAGIAQLDCVAVDSLRVRAHAGKSSFRTKERLLELQRLIKARVAELKAEIEADPASCTRRQQARREQAAQEREARLAAALLAADEIEAARAAEDAGQSRKTPKKRNKVRVSTTDPEARRMVLGNGGVAPAYSLQVKTDPKSATVIGISVSNNGSDRGQLMPALEEVAERYGTSPQQILADAGYDGRADIEKVEALGVQTYVPLPEKVSGQEVKAKDGPGVRAWKSRMQTEGAQSVYAQRMGTELPHAQMRNHGLQQFPVRGLDKVKSIALLFAVASNLLMHSQALIQNV